MSTLAALLVLGVALFFIVATLAVIGFVLKLLFWAILFPIRLALKLVFGLLGLGLAALLAPVLLVVIAVGIIGAIVAAVLAILAPLAPVLLVALVGWLIYRAANGRTYQSTNPRPY